ncbi:MAG: sigma-70 family RNA polymerase sigma factor [Cyanobacteria bacterium SBLK]|nr:sigma-70 family RNA polymerase sigma factor [Cyanobacteria bacterium SBLK]
MCNKHYQDCSTLETTPDRQLELAKDYLKVMLRETFDRLPLDRQNLLILGKGTHLTHAEMGLVVGCSQEQVYREAKRAKRNLLKNLAKTVKFAGNSLQTSDRLVALDTLIEAELPAQIQEFFGDRIQHIYQSLDADKQKSLASAFFFEKDN